MSQRSFPRFPDGDAAARVLRITARAWGLGPSALSSLWSAKLVKASQSEEIRRFVQADVKGAVVVGF